jgi:membrane protease YdiL (CAAX protease family)
LVALLGLTLLPVLLTSAAMRLVAPSPTHASLRAWLGGLPPSFLFYALANWLVLALVRALVGRAALAAKGLRLVGGWRRAGFALAGLALGVCIYLAVHWALGRMGAAGVAGMDLHLGSGLAVALMIATNVLTAPFCEEVFFRVIWTGMLSELPLWAAAALSTLTFAGIHYFYFGGGGVIFIALWSLVPLGLYLHFGDISSPLMMHVANNTWAYVGVPLLGLS